MQSSSLEVFKTHPGIILGARLDGGVGLRVGLHICRGPSQPKRFCYSMPLAPEENQKEMQCRNLAICSLTQIPVSTPESRSLAK